jgi:ferrochelatase
LKAEGVKDVVIAPIGFISDHMEVLYDLDTEARSLTAELGIEVIRAATVGAHPKFIKMIRELILERLDAETPRRALGNFPVSQDVCAADCCLSGMTRPAAKG